MLYYQELKVGTSFLDRKKKKTHHYPSFIFLVLLSNTLLCREVQKILFVHNLIQFIFSNVEMVRFRAVTQIPVIVITRSFLRRTEQIKCSKKTNKLSMCM